MDYDIQGDTYRHKYKKNYTSSLNEFNALRSKLISLDIEHLKLKSTY